MKHFLSIGLCLLLTASPLSILAQKQRSSAAAKDKPIIARMSLDGSYEEDFAQKQNAPGQTGNRKSKFKAEFKGNRWIVIAKDELGYLQFDSLRSGEPTSGSGSAQLEATSDYHDNRLNVQATESYNG